MSLVWPVELPQHVDRDSFQYTPQSGMIRTSMEAGLKKVRRRYTGTVKTYNVGMTMKHSQLELFESFFYNYPGHPTVPGVAGGVDFFEFPMPMWSASEGETEADRPKILVRFVIETDGMPYSVIPDGDTRDWKVSFTIERLP